MRSFRIPGRKFGRIATTAALLVATIVPSFAPALASAAAVTTRSIAMSSSSVGATATYNIKFTTTTAGTQSFVVDFCTVSPLFGEACATPAGMSTTGVSTPTANWTATSIDANTIQLDNSGTLGASTNVDVAVAGITNSTTAGTYFARIVTYNSEANATAEHDTADDPSTTTGALDWGSVAIAVTPSVDVSGAVLEALTFCVSGSTLSGTDCATGYTAPVLKLGKTSGTVVALDPTELSTGNVYTKISTNAAGGAVVSLKSSATCGGLALYGTGACNIAPAGNTGTFAAGTAKFGLTVTKPVDDAPNGIINVESPYDGTNYRFDFVDANSGVTSTYGDAIYNTNGGYANDRNTTLTFGASAAANTPAGRYSTSISLIATGTF